LKNSGGKKKDFLPKKKTKEKQKGDGFGEESNCRQPKREKGFTCD